MTILLDIMILLVIGIGIWRGYKHGLVRTLIRLVGCILALVIAALLSRPVAEGIFDTFLQENIEATVAESVSATAGKTVEEHIAAALDVLPESVQNVLDNAGWVERAAEGVDDSMDDAEAALAASIVQNMVRPVAVALISMLALLVLFVLLMIAVSLLSKVIGALFNIPVIKQINGVLGAVIGLLEGVLIAIVITALLQITAASSDKEGWITEEDIDDTILVSQMAENNPIVERWNLLPADEE